MIAVVIGFEQLVLGLPRAVVFPDGVRVFLLVDADQPGFLFHPDIAGHQPVVADHRQVVIIAEFRHRIRDEIMMRHGRHRKLKAAPFTHLAGIGAAGIDHMLASDRATFCFDKPFAVRLPGDVGGAAAPDDLHALRAGAGGKRLRDA